MCYLLCGRKKAASSSSGRLSFQFEAHMTLSFGTAVEETKAGARGARWRIGTTMVGNNQGWSRLETRCCRIGTTTGGLGPETQVLDGTQPLLANRKCSLCISGDVIHAAVPCHTICTPSFFGSVLCRAYLTYTSTRPTDPMA